MWTTLVAINWGRVLKYLLPIIAVIVILWVIYSVGSGHGAKSVQDKWDAERSSQQEELQRVLDANAASEANHRLENTRITHELAKIKETNAIAIGRLNTEYEQRLRQSATRAGVYQRQAESGAAECRSLASHAAELDRSLEQGLRLVKEFGTVVEQRDGQLRLLGAQILNDRELMGE